MKITSTTLFTWAVSIAAIGAIAVGASLLDSPAQTRMRKLDEQRVADLRRISTSIRDYFKANDRLPEHLEQLNLSHTELKDAVTAQPYEYTIRSADAYELCAVFDTVPDNDAPSAFHDYVTCHIPWHKRSQGRYCFILSTKSCK